MTLLDLARGPLFHGAMLILAAGIAWRTTGLLLLPQTADLSAPRSRNPLKPLLDGLRAVAMRSVPPHDLERNITFQHVTGYAWHIGWFLTFLFLGSHLPFLRSILGVSWPGLPNGALFVITAITLGILLSLYIRRLFHPVLRILTDADDHISVLLTILPLVTGLAAFAHWSPFGLRYEHMLAIHILSIEALMIWLPFGKIHHCITGLPARFRLGAAFSRRGVRV